MITAEISSCNALATSSSPSTSLRESVAARSSIAARHPTAVAGCQTETPAADDVLRRGRQRGGIEQNVPTCDNIEKVIPLSSIHITR